MTILDFYSDIIAWSEKNLIEGPWGLMVFLVVAVGLVLIIKPLVYLVQEFNAKGYDCNSNHIDTGYYMMKKISRMIVLIMVLFVVVLLTGCKPPRTAEEVKNHLSDYLREQEGYSTVVTDRIGGFKIIEQGEENGKYVYEVKADVNKSGYLVTEYFKLTYNDNMSGEPLSIEKIKEIKTLSSD